MRARSRLSTYGFKTYRHALICGILSLGSIVGFIVWGVYFDLFDRPIDWAHRPLATGGWFSWLVVGAFGVGYGGGIKLALRYAAYALGGILLLVLARQFA